MTPWHRAFSLARESPGFINLVDTNFHKAGWIHSPEALAPLWDQYLAVREYAPDCRGSRQARIAAAGLYSNLDPPPTEEDFFLTASTSEAYSLLFSILCAPGEKVLVPRPGYPLFEHLAELARVKAEYYSLEPDTWELSLEALEAAWTPQARILAIISPHNPTGRVFTPREILIALEFCRRHELALVWDEVFDPWVFPPLEDLPRPWEKFPQVPVFILNGISKRFASADLKLGWILCRWPEHLRDSLVPRLEMSNDSLLSCGSFPQFLLPHLFQGSGELIERMKKEAAANRRALQFHLGLKESTLPQGGLHALLEFPDCPWDDETLSIKLLRKGFCLHPGYFYDLPGCSLVLSLVHPPKIFNQAVQALAVELASLV